MVLLCTRTDHFPLLRLSFLLKTFSGNFSFLKVFEWKTSDFIARSQLLIGEDFRINPALAFDFLSDSKPHACKTTDRLFSTKFSLDCIICVQYSVKLYKKETSFFLRPNYWFSVFNHSLDYCHLWGRGSFEFFCDLTSNRNSLVRT